MTEIAYVRPGFFQSVARALRHYSDFEGRSTRSEFWWFVLFNALALSLCGVFDFIYLTPSVTLGSVLATIFSIVTLLPLLAVGVRRLRDSGDGWGHILWLLVPIAGIVILVFYWIRPTRPDAAEETGRWVL
jgi:uncharacterized membrane protein YhaH (DUF805 family)